MNIYRYTDVVISKELKIKTHMHTKLPIQWIKKFHEFEGLEENPVFLQ